jgi:hypothetical protein
MKTHVKIDFSGQIKGGEETSLREIIVEALGQCFIAVSQYETTACSEVQMELEHEDVDWIIRCLTSIFEGLNVGVEIEIGLPTPFRFIVA